MTGLTKPIRLKSGDTIGIVAPSDSISKKNKIQFEKGLNFIESMGFKIKFGEYPFCNENGDQRRYEEKAQDINEMFANKEIKAIICAQGGENSKNILPFLDYDTIKENPKPFIGMSDITCILNAIYKKTGLVTFHGNDIIFGFGRDPKKYDIEEFKQKFIKQIFDKINPNSDWKILNSGIAAGILIGGNLFCFLQLAGTEFFPDPENKILFIEEYKPTSEQFISMIHLLKDLGIFDKIKGLIIGHIDGLNEESVNIVSNVLKEYDFPIIKIEEFGHNTPNTVIPVGMEVKIDTNKMEITYSKC